MSCCMITLCNKSGEFACEDYNVIVDVVPRVGDVVQFTKRGRGVIIEALVIRVQHNLFHEQERAKVTGNSSGTSARVYVFLDVE